MFKFEVFFGCVSAFVWKIVSLSTKWEIMIFLARYFRHLSVATCISGTNKCKQYKKQQQLYNENGIDNEEEEIFHLKLCIEREWIYGA